MRIRTRRIHANQVRHSYYVSFLRWLADSLNTRAGRIVEKKFDDSRHSS